MVWLKGRVAHYQSTLCRPSKAQTTAGEDLLQPSSCQQWAYTYYLRNPALSSTSCSLCAKNVKWECCSGPSKMQENASSPFIYQASTYCFSFTISSRVELLHIQSTLDLPKSWGWGARGSPLMADVFVHVLNMCEGSMLRGKILNAFGRFCWVRLSELPATIKAFPLVSEPYLSLFNSSTISPLQSSKLPSRTKWINLKTLPSLN